MTLSPKVIAGPVKEPVSAAEIKLQTRVDTSAEDSLLAIYIQAARDFFEDAAAYTIHEETLEMTLNQWPGSYDLRDPYVNPNQARGIAYGYSTHIELPRATPLISVTSIVYTDSSGNVSTMNASDYVVDVDTIPGRIHLPLNSRWPTARLAPANGVRIRYVAGIPTSSPVTEAPGAIKLPILMLVAGMYENRESEVVTDRRAIQAFSMQYGVEAFIARIRDKVSPHSY